MLTESELLEKFENLSLEAEEFRHQDHLRLAWYLTGKLPLIKAIDRFVSGLKRFATHAGAPDLYNETITLFYLYEICARRQHLPGDHSWADFCDNNPDMLTSHREFIGSYYPENLLNSKTAKIHYIPPGLAIYDDCHFEIR